ncbi:TNT domain-containing protein [Actinomadura sp. NPDC047616]|uniref:TNT domain-containing protein n=1 Tax=Actinomadura sp. NPDC047616 TaxID=3155914 RepID=UPI0033E82CB9
MSVSGDRVAELEGQIVELVQRTAPPGWRRIDLRCAATVAVSEVTATVLTADGTAVPSEGVPSQLTDLLMELRRAHYEPERGTWFSVLFLIEPGGLVERLYNRDFDPLWDPPIPVECYQRDQVVMPRAAEHMPAWLAARLEGREPEHRPDPAPEPLNPVQQMELLTHDLAVLLADHAPALWRRLHGHYQAVGDHVELPPVMVFFDDGTMRPWTPPAAAGPLLDRLRAGMYAFEGSTWSRFEFQVRLENGRVLVDGSYSRDAEPAWNTEPTVDDVRRELQRFPMEKVPDWMGRRLGGTATRTLRKARVFDHAGSDGAPPSVSRPPVAPDEAERLADYLHNAPLVRAARSYAPDQLAPERGDRVPLTFHTDGTWIWAGAVGYYLREHGLPPEPDLVAHIRAQGFRIPEVDEPTLQAATAALSNKPAPPPPPAPGPATPPPPAADPAPPVAATPEPGLVPGMQPSEHEAPSPQGPAHSDPAPGAAPASGPASAPNPAHGAVPAQGTEEAAGDEAAGGYRWRTFELRPAGEVWIARVRRRLEEFGVDPGSYRLEETAEGAWCLVRDGLRWAVFRFEDGERRKEVVFDTGEQAAAQLLGALLLAPRQQDAPVPPADTPAPTLNAPAPAADAPGPPPIGDAPPTTVESPYEPSAGEPPLSLFRDTAEVELQVGDTVDRFGDADGNVAYTARIPFGQRSLPPDWANRPYHLYRVERPVRALAGVAIPWFDQPGGGTAYVFRRSLGELVAEGVLVEVRDAPPPPG